MRISVKEQERLEDMAVSISLMLQISFNSTRLYFICRIPIWIAHTIINSLLHLLMYQLRFIIVQQLKEIKRTCCFRQPISIFGI